MAFAQPPPRCKNLVLDAGPLLALSPLRGLAEKYLTVPQVLAELKDSRAREHFERLGLQAGVRIEVRSPDPASLAHVVQFAKKTGDYAVLSHADLSLVALTFALHEQAKAEENKPSDKSSADSDVPDPSTVSAGPSIESVSGALNDVSLDDAPETSKAVEAEVSSAIDSTKEQHPDDTRDDPPCQPQAEASSVIDSTEEQHPDGSQNTHNDSSCQPQAEASSVIDSAEEQHPDGSHDTRNDSPFQPQDVENESIDSSTSSHSVNSIHDPSKYIEEQLYEDPSDCDDGEGEWITPSNSALHRSRALELLPNTDTKSKGKKADTVINAGCMTADFAMQNVLLQMGLNLVSVEGKRIEKLKTWVLRCHACFKICKDASKKFCPSCGNPTLLRTSVTIAAPGASGDAPSMQIHLKKNFQYKNRGTIYSIPDPKPGSAKTGPGEGLILREDQMEYVRAKKRIDAKREREERKMMKGIFARGSEHGVSVGNWMDPDWIPEMMSVGTGGKGRKTRSGTGDEMPVIGYGKKNPNERKRK